MYRYRVHRALLLVIPVVVVLGVVAACVQQGDPALPASGFRDNFDGPELSSAWRNTGGPYDIREGQLHVQGARNKPLWLARRLPRDVRIEFDVTSRSEAGDIKVEVFGDGHSRAESVSYTATSYVVIFGGWNNSLNVIARMDEHAPDRAVGPRRPVEMGRKYHIKIERRGALITAWADGVELAHMNDSQPLEGRGHDHFGINNWESDLLFDNLQIHAL